MTTSVRRYGRAALLAVVALFVGGCGFAALPGPTQKKVTKADLVSVWQYPADYEKTTVTLELKGDGTFIQAIKRTNQAELQVHTGTWDLEGTSPKLTVLKPVFGDPGKPWVLEEAHWWIVDSYRKGVKFAIFGAADDRDPDACNEMKKLR